MHNSCLSSFPCVFRGDMFVEENKMFLFLRIGPFTVRFAKYHNNEVSLSSVSQEYDLEQKIDLEIKMREGTTKLLAVCQHRPQSLEAAKSLLTSNERMSAYMAELQRRKALDHAAILNKE